MKIYNNSYIIKKIIKKIIIPNVVIVKNLFNVITVFTVETVIIYMVVMK